MKFNLVSKYKSLLPYTVSIELPDFVVITGLNGSGKTQFLSGIRDKAIISDIILKSIKYVELNHLNPNGGMGSSREELAQSKQKTWETYSRFKNTLANKPSYTLEHFVQELARIQSPNEKQERQKQTKIIEAIATQVNKNVGELIEADIFDYYPLNDNLDQNEIFQHNFARIFKEYQLKLDENQYRQFQFESKGDKSIKFLTDKEFIQQFGNPPWALVNQVIKEAKLNYHVNSPADTHRDSRFELKLRSDITGEAILFHELSSGEKVLMSLALALLNVQFGGEFPELLLMDEPDSSLHPSMTKQFLDVIENVFVKDKKMKVIITTHSPSTVALAPEDSLFIMDRIHTRIEKTSKDKALKILTTGVPSLSINYENRRQIFVESKYDAEFYEKIYNKLQPHLMSEISLNFISSGVGGAGNCDQVQDVVNQLASFGNKTIFGIIDWDKKNNGNDYVKVLGKDKRYSIENYIFDPILISALLLDLRVFNKTDLGFVNNENYTDFKRLSTSQLQLIADFFITNVSSKFDVTDNTKDRVKYINGIEIEIPIWYLLNQGHDLEDKLKELFPILKKYHREGDLKREIANKIIDDIPEFIPSDILELFHRIQIT